MTLYKLESFHNTCVEDLPEEIKYHYQYQTSPVPLPSKKKPEKYGRMDFPFKTGNSFEKGKHLLNAYNFPPFGMKKIPAKNIFHLPTHTSRLIFMSSVELLFDDRGDHINRLCGMIYYYGDNFGYAIFEGYLKNRNCMSNKFYAFGCIQHQFINLTQDACDKYSIKERIRPQYSVVRCIKCGFWEVLDSSG